MERFTLRPCGARGMQVTSLGLGGSAIGRGPSDPQTDEAGARTLEAAYDLGLRHVDTSPGYGESERRLGIAIRRNEFRDLTISTKVGTHPNRRLSYTREDIRWSLHNSLSVLGRDFVDLALIHDPPSMGLVVRKRDGFHALIEMRDEGGCRNVGLGVQNHDFHRSAIEKGLVDIILTYGDYNIVRRTAVPLMRFAREHGVGVLLGSPQMHGFLAAGEEPRAVIERRPRLLNWYTEEDVAVAQEWFEWCREREVCLRRLNMRYVMGCGWADCVLTGASSASEARTNVHEAITPLPDDVWEEALIRIQELDERSS